MDFVREDHLEQFQLRLAETIAWCSSQDPLPISGTGLRTDQLRPPEIVNNARAIYEARLPRDEEAKQLARNAASEEQQWLQNVEQLAAKRAMLLQTQHIPIGQVAPPLTYGRLLAYLYEQSTGDGAAEVASDGFFDSDNIPAWDTWLVYIAEDHLLLSWIPDTLFKIVEDGMDVNWEECIRWAADLEMLSISQLKQAGFVR